LRERCIAKYENLVGDVSILENMRDFICKILYINFDIDVCPLHGSAAVEVDEAVEAITVCQWRGAG